MDISKKLSPVRSLTCCCCGSGTQGRQWWNRDTGYGLCEECAVNLPTKHGVSPEEMRDLYGERGVHYDLEFVQPDRHTPGPWEMRPVPGLACICIAQPGQMHSHAHVTEPCGEPAHLGPREYANAALIAAAPEMLDALHHILNIEGACSGADASWNLDWHWDKVRAAIAKAEGRQA